MQAIWKPIAATLILLAIILALTGMQNGHPGLDPRDQLNFERQVAVRRGEVAATVVPAALACAAPRVARATVWTLYLVWVNNRPDLAPEADRDAASRDLAGRIDACGAKVAAVEDDAHAHGLDLEADAAIALLKAGR